MEALIRALPKLLSAAGDNEEVAEAAARIAWKRAAGGPLCQHAVPFRLYHTTLIVAVSDAIWQRQMSALSGQLLSRLNGMLGQKTITFIEFRIDPKTVEAERAPRQSIAGGESAESVLHSVPDEVTLAAADRSKRGPTRPLLHSEGGAVEIHVSGLHRPLLVCRRFLLGEELLVSKLGRPLHGRQRGVVPDSLQVRMAVGRARRGPGFRGRLRSLRESGYGRQKCDCDQNCKNESKFHVTLPPRNDK